LNSGHELEIRFWDEPDISTSPAAFEAIAFCELLMRSVKKQLARRDSVEALGREKSPVAPASSGETQLSSSSLVLPSRALTVYYGCRDSRGNARDDDFHQVRLGKKAPTGFVPRPNLA